MLFLLLMGATAPPGLLGQEPPPGAQAREPVAPLPEAMKAFLAARGKDLTAGTQEPHRSFLLEMSRQGLGGKDPWPEQVWALTRLVEAGEYSRSPAWVSALTDHLLGTTQPARGRQDRILPFTLPQWPKIPVPVYRVHADSPFWANLGKIVRSTEDREVSSGLYSVWCYHTRPEQRDLILEVARQVKVHYGSRNRTPDPWNDPRFWIVLDWAIAWGGPEDFQALEGALPVGAARAEFRKRTDRLKAVPGFFGPDLPRPEAEGRPAEGLWLPSGMEGVIRALREAEAGGMPPTPRLHLPRVKAMPPAPGYPPEARSRGLMNRFVMNCLIDEEGRPVGLRPQPGPWLAFFAPTAAEWAKDIRFTPATLDGRAVKAPFVLSMPFSLMR